MLPLTTALACALLSCLLPTHNALEVAASTTASAHMVQAAETLAAPLPQRTAAGNTALGCNPGGPGNRHQVFADWTKSSIFGQPDAPGSQNTTVDDDRGWPTQDFSLLFYNEPGGYYYPAADLSGTYTVTALGCAQVSFPEGFGGMTVLNQSCPGGNLLAYVDISSDGDAVKGQGALVFTNTTRGAGKGAGLTNVSFLLPGYPPGTDPDTLHEPALANIRGRCTVARFIGWAMFGHSAWDTKTPPTPCDWSIRPKPGDPTYFLGGWGTHGLGVPYEIIAKVANAIETDAWILVPSGVNETARDEYVTELVKLFDSLLPPGRKLYLEYANECFFGNNQCYDDDQTLANITVMQKGDPYKLNFGLESPPNITANLNTWNARMYAWTARHFAHLAAGVVGAERVGRADKPGVRVVPVVGAMGSYAKDGWNKLQWLTDAWGPPADDGLATMNIGAYFGAASNVTSDPNVTPDEVIESMLATIAAQDTTAETAYGASELAQFAAASAYYGVALHAYEGGPSTAGGKGDGIMALAKACQDARMADVVANIIAVWQSWTGGTFNYFQLGAQPLQQPWGSYTNLWDLKQPDSPKTRGIDRVVKTPPAPMGAGWPAPLIHHNASFYVGYYTKDKTPPTSAAVTWLPLGTTMHYLVRFSSPQECANGINVTVTMSSTLATGGDPLEVSIGSFLPATNISSPKTNGSKTDLHPVTALFPKLPAGALPSGLVTVQLRVPIEGVKYELWYLDVSCRMAATHAAMESPPSTE